MTLPPAHRRLYSVDGLVLDMSLVSFMHFCRFIDIETRHRLQCVCACVWRTFWWASLRQNTDRGIPKRVSLQRKRYMRYPKRLLGARNSTCLRLTERFLCSAGHVIRNDWMKNGQQPRELQAKKKKEKNGLSNRAPGYYFPFFPLRRRFSVEGLASGSLTACCAIHHLTFSDGINILFDKFQ